MLDAYEAAIEFAQKYCESVHSVMVLRLLLAAAADFGDVVAAKLTHYTRADASDAYTDWKRIDWAKVRKETAVPMPPVRSS